MSRSRGTFEATAVTTRQKFGTFAATFAFMVAFTAPIGGWAFLFAMSDGPSGLDNVTETASFLGSWAYLYIPQDVGAHVVGYAHPPIAFWMGLAVWSVAFLGAGVPGLAKVVAAAKGKTTGGSRWGAGSAGRLKKANRDELLNLTRQLHERRIAGLSPRRAYLWRSVGLIGAVLVLAVALFGGTPPDVESGLTMDDPQRGLQVWVAVVSSLIGIVGLLLAFPYGSREKVVVDAMGNVRGADEPAQDP